MRHFCSYGPVDCRYHFAVARKKLVEQSIEQLIGIPEEGGHYFTIWAPRQTGKTWLMRQIKQKIKQQYPEEFTLVSLSFGGLRGMRFSPKTDTDCPPAFCRLLNTELPSHPEIKNWEDFRQLFSRTEGLWNHSLILLIDEVDTIPLDLIDLMVAQFRELYLNRETNWLHGLALIGVRAVLGIESQRGSPFNIQRSLQVPNLSFDEVKTLYQQYQNESRQIIESAVVEAIYDSTRGQPGLVSWFGELLTEKYNPGSPQVIGMETWRMVWHKAKFAEPNNTVMNLIAKARVPEYQAFLLKLFGSHEIPFSFHHPICSYLYFHGIIESETLQQSNDKLSEICRFSSPFIQNCLYHALSAEIVSEQTPILPLQPLDDLTDVFTDTSLELPALLQRYKDYLARLKAKGINPWKAQPRRKTDFHLTESVGHFHLFAWLEAAVGKQCIVSPEFPTGNGEVDLHLRCGDKHGIIEVKSFVNSYEAKLARQQAAKYAKQLGMEQVTVAMFVPVDEETVLEKLSQQEMIKNVQVTVVAISWT